MIIATPWEWHAPMAIDAMEAKVPVGCEVVAGISLQDHWDVLETQLDPGELSSAKAAAHAFRATSISRAANMTPLLADLSPR